MQNVQAGLDESASSSRIESVKTEVLKTVAYTLLYVVNEPQKIDVQYDINFYDEVRPSGPSNTLGNSMP